jgi:hypothetical protein
VYKSRTTTLLGSDYGICFMSPFWRLSFEVAPRFWGSLCNPAIYICSRVQDMKFFTPCCPLASSLQLLPFRSEYPPWYGAAVAQLVETLRYKPEGHGFDSRCCHWNFRSHYGPEYQEYFLGGKRGRCVGLTTLPPSSADCLEIWELQPPGTLRACPGL